MSAAAPVEDSAAWALLVGRPVRCVFDPAFLEAEAERVLLVDAPETPEPDTTWYDRAMAGLIRGRERGRAGKLSPAQERAAFLAMNYRRWRARQLQAWAARRGGSAAMARECLGLVRAADRVRGRLVGWNLPLVVRIAAGRDMVLTFEELVSEGNDALLKAVDHFDCRFGFKFSSYAERAVRNSFNRAAALRHRQRQRDGAEHQASLDRPENDRAFVDAPRRELVEFLRREIAGEGSWLTPRERAVLAQRFGPGRQPRLDEVAARLGVSTERAGQLERSAMQKLRERLATAVG